ncbi:MAG: aminopeptidase [Acidobacteria bacterium]|nr:aminopeptidase [Acidobacteriota bacterium]
MIEPVISPESLDRWARLLVEHSLGGVTSDDRVMIKGERIAWPLMERIEREVIARGGTPDVYLVAPNNERGRVWSASMGRSGTPEQLERVPAWHRERYSSMTKYVEVLGAESPESYSGLSAQASAALARADRPFADLRLSRRWVITLFPTPAYAAIEGMSLDEYTQFIVQAATVDPMPLLRAEEKLAPFFETGHRVEIDTFHPGQGRELRLTMDLSESVPVMSYGLRNVPDGEIFTSPDARSVEGEIYLDLPVLNSGTDIAGMHLVFEKGCITSFSAREGQTQLATIIGTDEGSRRLGEFALGMNPGLTRALKHPLFVEKLGGTLHIAIGASYEKGFVKDPSSPEARARIEDLTARGVFNRSAQHVDIVADFRPGGCGRRVAIDGQPLVVRDGVWVPG